MHTDTFRPARRLALVVSFGLLCGGLHAQPTAKPEELGLSPAGLAKIGDWMRAEVAAKKIPGATIVIVRGGKIVEVGRAAELKTPDGARVVYRADQFLDGLTELWSVPLGGGTATRLNDAIGGQSDVIDFTGGQRPCGRSAV